MQMINIFIPLNHYRHNSPVYNEQTEIQIINSDKLNKFIKLNKSTKEEFDYKDYIKLVSDN